MIFRRSSIFPLFALLLFVFSCLIVAVSGLWQSTPPSSSPDADQLAKPSSSKSFAPPDLEKPASSSQTSANVPSPPIGTSSISDGPFESKERQFSRFLYSIFVDASFGRVRGVLQLLGFDDTQVCVFLFFTTFFSINLLSTCVAWHFYGHRISRMHVGPSTNGLARDFSVNGSSNTPVGEAVFDKED